MRGKRVELDADVTLGRILDHYAARQSTGDFDESEMEGRMDRARAMTKEQLTRLWHRIVQDRQGAKQRDA